MKLYTRFMLWLCRMCFHASDRISWHIIGRKARKAYQRAIAGTDISEHEKAAKLLEQAYHRVLERGGEQAQFELGLIAKCQNQICRILDKHQ